MTESIKKRRKILLVDDDSMHNKLVIGRLPADEFDVIAVEDGTDLIGLIEREKIELVLLDIFLKHESGLDLLDTIRLKFQPNALPVLMVTSNFEPDNIVAGLNRGANDYLSKPINFAVAVARINTQLSILDLFRNNFRHQQRDSINALIVTINQEITAPISAAIGHLQAGITANDLNSMKAAEIEMNKLANLVRKINQILNANSITLTQNELGTTMVKLI